MTLPGPKSLLGIRSMIGFRRNPMTYAMKLAREYGDIAYFEFGKIPAVLQTTFLKWAGKEKSFAAWMGTACL